ncbi:MAG: hypothetical protein M3170_01355 [Candidatus Dormibacteraeota bacterium]|nr:hypothetical protein [Candidatus Dormibacteraeota bacterium]
MARRRPGAPIVCLAWIGLRRALESDLHFGLLGPRELAAPLNAIFER